MSFSDLDNYFFAYFFQPAVYQKFYNSVIDDVTKKYGLTKLYGPGYYTTLYKHHSRYTRH